MFVDVTYAHFPFMPFYWPEGTFCCEVLIILIIGNSFTNQAFSSNGGLRLLHYLVLSAISRRANTNQITLFHWVFLWQSMNELHCTVTVHLTQHRPQLPV